MRIKTGMIVISTEPGANTRAMAFASSQKEVDDLFVRFAAVLRVMRRQALEQQRLQHFAHVTAMSTIFAYMVYNPSQESLLNVIVLLSLPDLRDTLQTVHSVSFLKTRDCLMQYYTDVEGQQYVKLIMQVNAHQRIAVG